MSEFHVVPCGDLVKHETEGDQCVCGPDVEFIEDAIIVVHHSLDGREQDEEER